jgi:acetylornithine deacetylase/succinyl-diaminopimelate desuccinylase-like protein
MVVAKDPARANIIARLKGNGSKRPLLIMAHSDVVKVDPAKWTFPPFSARTAGPADARLWKQRPVAPRGQVARCLHRTWH